MSFNQITSNSGFYNLRKTIQRKISKGMQLASDNKKINDENNQEPVTNPYEVVRAQKKPKPSKHRPIENFVFSNPALDIHCAKPTLKTIEGDFEITRKAEKSKSSKEKGCFENPALEIPRTAIILPFKPNVGVQIKFDTPVKTPALGKSKTTCKGDLQSSPPCIDKELEYYENQWENSINETKNARSIKDLESNTPNRLRKVKSGKITPLKQTVKKLNLKSASKVLTYSKETAV